MNDDWAWFVGENLREELCKMEQDIIGAEKWIDNKEEYL